MLRKSINVTVCDSFQERAREKQNGKDRQRDRSTHQEREREYARESERLRKRRKYNYDTLNNTESIRERVCE